MKKIMFLIVIFLEFNNLLISQNDNNKLQIYLKEAFEADSLELYDKEQEILNKIIVEYPNSDSAYARRSRVKVIKEDLDGAMRDIEDAIKINPKSDYAFYRRGVIKNKLKKYQEAIEDYTQAIKLNPKEDNYYLQRGYCFHTQQNFVKAIEDYTQVIKLNPKSENAYFNRGKIYNELKRYSEAIHDFTDAININPKNENYYHSSGNAKNQFGQYQRAILDFNKAIELNPKYVPSYAGRGASKFKLEKYKDAIDDLNKAIELNPQDEFAFKIRGWSHYALGNWEQVITDYTAVINFNKSEHISNYYTDRGIAYYKLGNYKEAIEDYNKALAIDPNSEQTKKNKEVAELNLKELNSKSEIEEKELKATIKSLNEEFIVLNDGLLLFEKKGLSEIYKERRKDADKIQRLIIKLLDRYKSNNEKFEKYQKNTLNLSNTNTDLQLEQNKLLNNYTIVKDKIDKFLKFGIEFKKGQRENEIKSILKMKNGECIIYDPLAIYEYEINKTFNDELEEAKNLMLLPLKMLESAVSGGIESYLNQQAELDKLKKYKDKYYQATLIKVSNRKVLIKFGKTFYTSDSDRLFEKGEELWVNIDDLKICQ